MGSEGFEAYLDEVDARFTAAIPGMCGRAMEMVRAEVATQTPIETGNLVGSEEVITHPDGADILIPGPYARRQHYELTYRHNTGNALFLELPMVQKAQAALDMIQAEVNDLL